MSKKLKPSLSVLQDFFFRDKPLAMYIFTSNDDVRNTIVSNTSSGGICCNDTIMHFGGKFLQYEFGEFLQLKILFTTVDTLPFGGVGPSGMGNYHGKYSFDAFTQKRSCLVKKLDWFGEKLSQ